MNTKQRLIFFLGCHMISSTADIGPEMCATCRGGVLRSPTVGSYLPRDNRAIMQTLSYGVPWRGMVVIVINIG